MGSRVRKTIIMDKKLARPHRKIFWELISTGWDLYALSYEYVLLA